MSFHNRNNRKRTGFNRGKAGWRMSSGKHALNRPEAEYRHQDQLSENEVGISEYISKFEGYSAVIKARFSDFQVSEINLEGNLAKLTDQTVPKDFVLEQITYSYEDVERSPAEKIPQETWEALKQLVKGISDVPVILEAQDFSKDERKSIHTCIKNYFGKEIVASTVQQDEKHVMEFKKYQKGGTQRADNRTTKWPDNVPEYVYFVVYKELMDTMEACFKIGQSLHIPHTKITYAGVKDRRAKTTQWFCIKKCDPSKLIARTSHIRNLHVGNIEFKEKCLKIGQLRGNKFRIALRNVQAEDDLINRSMEHVKEYGFINYFGMQRFGNDKETPTFLIGIKLLQGLWEEAVDLILKVKGGDDLSLPINKAKKLYSETKDAEAALKLCDWSSNSIEKKLLAGLSKHDDKDLVNALESIPRYMRLMYIHAFQSYIWNKMTSKRIQEFGLKPVEGDLVFIDNRQEEDCLLEDDENSEIDGSEVSLSNEENQKSETASVRPLLADELDKYTINDIVLPLPGHDVIYPDNMKQHYKEAIEECGLQLEMPKQKVRTYNLSGTYRKICQRVEDIDWKILFYDNPTDNLIRSDLEEMRGEAEPTILEAGKYKAILVSFTLRAASYATMVLRDMLKCNTSSSFQAGLNNYAESEKVPTPSETKNDSVEINNIQPGSLLADKEKYEDFKNNLFKDILGESEENETSKRELENDDETESNSKKLKANGD